MNGSLRLSADQRVINNKTVLTNSQIFDTRGNWNEGLLEMRIKLPKGDNLSSSISMRSKTDVSKRIDLISVISQEQHIITSGITYGNHKKGFEGILPFDITSDYIILTIQSNKHYICWKINGNIYLNETTHFETEFQNQLNKTGNLLKDQFFIVFDMRLSSKIS